MTMGLPTVGRGGAFTHHKSKLIIDILEYYYFRIRIYKIDLTQTSASYY